LRNRPSIADLLAEGRLERVAADEREAKDLLEHAQRHLESALAIARSDPAGSYQLLYDATRKAIAADMAAAGVRTKSDRPGAHAAVVLYAEEALRGVLDAESLETLDQMRRLRNRSEYGGVSISAAQLETDHAYAVAIVRAVVARLG
jgi:hypothetical protein